MQGLQVDMETDDEGVSSWVGPRPLQLVGVEGQGGGAAHWLEQTERALLAQ